MLERWGMSISGVLKQVLHRARERRESLIIKPMEHMEIEIRIKVEEIKVRVRNMISYPATTVKEGVITYI